MDSDSDAEVAIPLARELPVFTAAGVANSKPEWLSTVDRARLPLSYRGNTTKEQLCLEYVDNFRTQFQEAFPERPPLFLTALNEAGVPKFVCTTLRPALLPAKALYDLEQCTDFVAKYIRYEPLADPCSPPEYLLSPASTVQRRAGDCFDMAVTLVTLLLGAGFDAMCAVGTAPAEVTLRDTHRLRSTWEPPELPEPATGYKRDFTKGLSAGAAAGQTAGSAAAATAAAASGAGGGAEPSAYAAQEPPSLKSAFDEEMLARAAESAAAAAKEDAEYASDDEAVPRGQRRDVSWVADGRRGAASGVAPTSEEEDPLRARRVHCWVVVRPGPRGVGGLLHIEPSTGRAYSPEEAPYLHCDVVFNHKNLWVNMQEPPEGALPPDALEGAAQPEEGDGLLSDAEAVERGLAGRREALDGDMGVPPLRYDPTGRVILDPHGDGPHGGGKEADDGHAGDHDGDDEEDDGEAADPIEAAKRRVLAILAKAPTKPRALAAASAAAALLERLASQDTAAAKPGAEGAAGAPSAIEAMRAEAEAEDREAAAFIGGATAAAASATAGGGGGGAGGADSEGKDADEGDAGDAAAGAGSVPEPSAPIGLISFQVDDQHDWENVFLDPDPQTAEAEGEGEAAADDAMAAFGSAASGRGDDGATTSAASRDDESASGATGAQSRQGAKPADGSAADGADGSAAAAEAAAAASELQLEEDGEHILDLPAAWVKPLRLPRYAIRDGLGLDEDDSFGQREIRSLCTETRWAPRAHPRGVVCRVVRYADDARLCEEEVVEHFADREDGLFLRVRRPAEGVTEEHFLPGREDGLRSLVETFGLERDTRFFASARTDALVRRLEVFGRKISEWYDGEATPDRLEFRSVTFLGKESVVRQAGLFPADPTAAITTGDPVPADLMVTSVTPTLAATGGVYVIRKMAEKFARNPALPAHRDVAKLKFLLLTQEIEARYHTAEGRVVPNTRLYKSRRAATTDVSEASAEGHLDVTMLTEDSFSPVATPYEKEVDFRNAVLEQKRCFEMLKQTYKGCTEVLMGTREAEEAAPRLVEDAFAEASRRVREGVALEDKDDGDDGSATRRVDYLAPFLVDVPDPYNMDEQTALKVQMKCEKALRRRHIDRMDIIQRHLQAEQEALQRRQREFSRTRGDGSEEAEAEFQKAISDHMFRIGVLRARATRQEQVMMEKLQELMATFRADNRLSAIYEGKASAAAGRR
ncbi:hypothetical protein FNF31_05832 [Cafeteria roenbergensis]|uniref:Uncharacterized protein n=2 Tax=Cafeteria roenbergensis TaxID=33653 RepID=A0A5A8CW25_CAFRO|nr:hypothetical protein FNF31_05832 [Cafeteria roenbergensis]KAA0170905.1 hypothetical protein FNF28_01178 [Cafeteria roenbergensis]